MLDNARTAASLHHQDRELVDTRKINYENIDNMISAVYLTGTNVHCPKAIAPHRKAIGTAMNIAVGTNISSFAGTLSETRPVLTLGQASTCTVFDTESSQSDSTLSESPPEFCDMDNVRIAARLHRDREYVDALEICCIHELRGKRCTSIKFANEGPLLCQDLKRGWCAVTKFAHDGSPTSISFQAVRAH